ncbi:MAG: hypothetical protein ABH869_04830 [Candidatus Omnitrophota bacterium]
MTGSGITFAGEEFGPRIPTAYVATTGTGESDEGIPPDPYETFSYDIALAALGFLEYIYPDPINPAE